MSVLIIESCEKRSEVLKNTGIVHVKNSCVLRDELGYDLLSHASEIEPFLTKKYDRIIAMYCSPYMRYNEYIQILHNNPDAKIYWMMNDHDCEDNIMLRKWIEQTGKSHHMLCNNPREGYRKWVLKKKNTVTGKEMGEHIDEWYTLDLNTLIFDNEIYYAFMANRFYECVMYNVLVFYDERCMDTITRSGYKIDKFQIVSNGEEMQKKCDHLDSHPEDYDFYLSIQQSNVPKILWNRQLVLDEIEVLLR